MRTNNHERKAVGQAIGRALVATGTEEKAPQVGFIDRFSEFSGYPFLGRARRDSQTSDNFFR